MRFILTTLALALLAATPLRAGDEGLTGFWKFAIHSDGPQTLWLIQFDKTKDGKLTATADALKGAPKAKLDDIKLGGDTLTMRVRATILGQGGPREIIFDYEGKLPKPGAKKIFGSMREGGATIPAVMEATSAKTVFELDRDTLQRTPTDPRAFNALFDVIELAKENKLDVKDLQSLVDGSLKAAELYGPRFQMKHQLSLLKALQGQKMYAEIGIETARKIGKQVDAQMPLNTQLEILSQVAGALRAGGQAGEASTLEVRVDKLEGQAYDEYGKKALNFKTEKFGGRKAKSNRAVLVELFTGAQCPPCVAADMAFDGLEKTYGPGEVVLLQYHMHIPAPDPLSNSDNDARFEQYVAANPTKVSGTPATLFNGKVEVPGGGARDDAPEKYKDYCEVVNKQLETALAVKLSATATRTGDKIAIVAKVQNLEKPGDKVRLRLALVEDWVRYKGRNGLQYHHRIVRALPGGAKGVAVGEKEFDYKASVDLGELRASLNKYLDEDYTDGPRPMRLRHLSVVAFVQNDASSEVLQAINVPLKSE
ncbi:MAG: DUF1223 domain-containing protein [Gemmataceae bacterium]|nr:DUF1223 domain-containing protein [Gemmataceae bacterium]